MLKDNIRIVEKKGLCYIADNRNTIKRFKPWLGDSFSFLYDFIMSKSVFPKKFGGDMGKHIDILQKELKDVRGENVLELATGSGSAVDFLHNSNHYTGSDISEGLLRQAVKNFMEAGFKETKFYVTGAEELPFADDMFDVCLCILSLNFFSDAETVFKEIKRVLSPGGIFICSVPVPEKNKRESTIRGRLHSEQELKNICVNNAFKYESINAENGVLLYFRAVSQ